MCMSGQTVQTFITIRTHIRALQPTSFCRGNSRSHTRMMNRAERKHSVPVRGLMSLRERSTRCGLARKDVHT
ncbi:hypothetical protein IEO21_09358 [Rhodonia placenta]|uniref:Uncharacterized protein n=1 Tax=Rhodonia placenta TaxID=104341 RepID=A0A8H7TYB4_9APHY|nr:hypothetical protein IEO21_09358 [Postia placenta]